MNKPNIFKPIRNLDNLNIWLSGAIPERDYWPTSLTDRDILEFVSFFSALIFQKGGTIIHGCHPVFTPIIAQQAKKFATSKSQLRLFVSNLWGDDDIKHYSSHAEIVVVPSYNDSKELTNIEVRNRSLTMLRDEIVDISQCIVSIGGKLHPNTHINPGVIEELQIAKSEELPSYVIGSFGGAASQPRLGTIKTSKDSGFSIEIVTPSEDNKFLTSQEAFDLFNDTDISFLPSSLVSYLERDYLELTSAKSIKNSEKKSFDWN